MPYKKKVEAVKQVEQVVVPNMELPLGTIEEMSISDMQKYGYSEDVIREIHPGWEK